MSGQFSTALMFFSLVAIALAANVAEQDEREPAKRTPAALAMRAKEQKLGAYLTAPDIRHTEKLRGPLGVKLEITDAPPVAVGDVFVVRGTVSARENLDGVDYSWSLPAGAQLIHGELRGRMQSLPADQPAHLEVTLKRISPGNLQIHLLAGSSSRGGRFADSAQLNTDDTANSAAAKTAGGPASESKTIKVFH
jgi:hypothetical protein